MPMRAAKGSPVGARRRATAAHCAEPGPDCPLGGVLLRLRPAEIGQHPVAHELRDVAAEALDLGDHGRLVGAMSSRISSGSRAERELGRADEIAEQDGDQPTLRRDGRSGWAGRVECGQGREQPAPMPDRVHPDADQIGLGEVRQDVRIDVVVAEGLLVALEPQPAQPSPDVHLAPLRSKRVGVR